MEQTETYVDPAIAGNSGTGTSGDPYGDLQYALNTMTPDATNGDRINIKAGTAEVLAEPISLTTYLTGHTPAITHPLTFQGYTATAGDGGQGAIDVNGNQGYSDSTTDYVHWRHLKWTNSGASAQHFIDCDRYCNIVQCEFNATNIDFPIYLPGYGTNLIGCKLYNVATSAFAAINGWCGVYGNYISGAGNNATYGLVALTDNSWAINNILVVSHVDAFAIRLNGSYAHAVGNSIYSSAANTKAGIFAKGTNNTVTNNIMSGFSGAGGAGLEVASGKQLDVKGYNAFYQCTDNEVLTGVVAINLGGDVSCSASPFTNAASGDFSVSTELKAAGWPNSWYQFGTTTGYLDIGAVQRVEPAGGGGGLLAHAGMTGGMNG